jgi:hypothetical protein
LYYCAVDSDGKFTLHRKGMDGPVIGTSDPCATEVGDTDLHFADPKSNISLHHEKHMFHHSKTNFSIENKHYHWKGHDDLIEEETQDVVAKFHTKSWQDDVHRLRLGQLDVAHSDNQDVFVFTALVVLKRAEGKLPPFYEL